MGKLVCGSAHARVVSQNVFSGRKGLPPSVRACGAGGGGGRGLGRWLTPPYFTGWCATANSRCNHLDQQIEICDLSHYCVSADAQSAGAREQLRARTRRRRGGSMQQAPSPRAGFRARVAVTVERGGGGSGRPGGGRRHHRRGAAAAVDAEHVGGRERSGGGHRQAGLCRDEGGRLLRAADGGVCAGAHSGAGAAAARGPAAAAGGAVGPGALPGAAAAGLAHCWAARVR